MSLPPNGQFWRGENYGEAPPPNATIPEFFVKEVEVRQGGVVVSRFPREMVRFRCAGDTSNSPEQIVTERIRQEFGLYYHAWKNQTGDNYGTPLENWNLLSADQVRTLKAVNIFTVEQMAAVTESFVSGMPMGPHLKKMAQQYVDQRVARDEAERAKVDKDANTRALNMAMEEMHKMRAELDALKAREPAAAVDVDDADDEEDSVAGQPVRRGPGRPRKNPENVAA